MQSSFGHFQQSWQSFRSAFAELPSIVNGIFGDNRPPLLLMTATLPRSIQDQMSSDFKLASDTKLFRVYEFITGVNKE